MSGLQRPGFKPNVQRAKALSRRNETFFSIAPDTTARVRFLPPATEEGMIFVPTVNHFNLKDAEGKSIAVACLNQHGEGNCPICSLVSGLYASGNDEDRKLAADLRANTRFNAQILVAEKDKDTGKWMYEGPRVLAVSKTVHDNIVQILDNQDMVGDHYFCDADNGQDLLISRTGQGFKTEYTVDRTGIKVPLDEVFPGWEAKFWTNLPEKLGQRILSRADVLTLLELSYGKRLDFDALRAEGII